LFRLALGIVAAVTLVRIAVLIISPLQLYPDEAQYWWWAQTPDWGYFSKPPLIAWIIRLTTLGGDPEWAIRIASPILHGATAMVLFGIGRVTSGDRVGFWSALAYATLPGVSYSSGLISTDVPLLFCWAVALYALLRARDSHSWHWPFLCGSALGIGLLAKYAMAYFPLCAVVAAIVVPSIRTVVLSLRGAAILGLGLLFLSPNLLWNATHGFPTLAHTGANANWSHARYSVGSAAAFIAGQFGVFGPFMMAAYLAGLYRPKLSPVRRENALILAAFSVPVLILMVVQSFISEANANWAATAYVAAAPLAIAVLLSWWNARGLWMSLGLSAAVLLALLVTQSVPSVAEVVGLGNALGREQGWKRIGEAVAAQSRRSPYEAIVAGNRSVLAELLYYARPRSLPVRAWDVNAVPRDHFQMTMPLEAPAHRVLLAIVPEEAKGVLATFDSARRLLTLPVHVGRSRTLGLYDARGYRGPQNHP